MNLTRRMMRHGKEVVAKGVTVPRVRERTIKKGTPYRRLLAAGAYAVHATKGRSHPRAVLDYRAKQILQALGVPAEVAEAA